MPRFVLLRHETPAQSGKASHWDLMVESDGRLLTWNLDALPGSWHTPLGLPLAPGTAAQSVPALAIADHRLAYLEYEGPLTNDQGRVEQCDGGTFAMIAAGPDRYCLRLAGRRLAGHLELQRTAGDRWQLHAGG